MEKTLFQLDAEWIEMESLLNKDGGILSEDDEKRFDEICTALAEKRGSYIYVRDNFEKQIEQGKQWISVFQNKVRQIENRKKQMDSRLMESMKAQELDTQETEFGKIRIQSSQSLSVFDLSKVPKKYKKTIIETVSKNAEIKAALKDKVKVPGATLLTKEFIKIYK